MAGCLLKTLFWGRTFMCARVHWKIEEDEKRREEKRREEKR